MKEKQFESHKKYQAPESADSIVARIFSLEADIAASLKNLFN